jgi:hypothetical protein
MSTRNREKRAARHRGRQRDARRRERVRPHAHPGGLSAALSGAARCPCGDTERHAAELLAEFGQPGRELDLAVESALSVGVCAAWVSGWLPADLRELTRRTLEPVAARVVAEAIVVDSRRYAPATVHPRWQTAVDAVAAEIGAEVERVGMAGCAAGSGASRAQALAAVLRALGVLVRLPVLERLLPLPGALPHSVVFGGVFGGAADGAVDHKVLAKVRALLAKAESTDYPDEAEALSAKAQELMSRHSLQHALLDHDRGRVPEAGGRRLWMEAPYPGAKALLVQAVATANRCRTVWRADPGFVTVVGPDTELDIVELLSTSLLVQANRAMLAAGRQATRGGTSRTRSFRQSFLIAYAARIGERLTAASEAATTEVAARERLLPVLAARSRAADETIGRLFPRVVQRAVSVSNAAGWRAGRAAADLAELDLRSSIAG